MGAWPADRCLAESRNIPFVDLLQYYHLEKFYLNLQNFGFTQDKEASHYGLAFILGGAEAHLFDMANLYRNLWAQAKNFPKKKLNELLHVSDLNNEISMSQNSAIHCLQALQRHKNANGIAYKTGTSFGHRDAWAIGMDAEKLVAVWIGNADYEAQEGLTGMTYAVPVMQDVFRKMGVKALVLNPVGKEIINTCENSGYKASVHCAVGKSIMGTSQYQKAPTCRLCQPIVTDSQKTFRYNYSCQEDVIKVSTNFFVLPPAMEYYYSKKNPFYEILPPLYPDCQEDETPMEVISPSMGEKILLPRKWDGSRPYVVIKAYHRSKNETLTWIVNGKMIHKSQGVHSLPINASPGEIKVTLIDEQGHYLDHLFEVVEHF